MKRHRWVFHHGLDHVGLFRAMERCEHCGLIRNSHKYAVGSPHPWYHYEGDKGAWSSQPKVPACTGPGVVW